MQAPLSFPTSGAVLLGNLTHQMCYAARISCILGQADVRTPTAATASKMLLPRTTAVVGSNSLPVLTACDVAWTSAAYGSRVLITRISGVILPLQ